MRKRILAIVLAAALLATLPMFSTASAPVITITNPYADVVWGTWDAYLGQLHTHSTAGDGYHDFRDVIEYHYYFGYDLLAMTEHGVVDRGWVGSRPNALPIMRWAQGGGNWGRWFSTAPLTGLTQERYDQINAGYGRDGRGMIRVPYGIEQNPISLPNLTHVVSLYADWGNAWWGGSMDYSAAVRGVHRAGGISFIAHPGEVPYHWSVPLAEAWEGGSHYLWRIQTLLEQYDSLIGFEIPGAHDRKLWDVVLTNLAPTGRNVFGVQTSDMHRMDRIFRGYTWHMMPENNAANVRVSLETGAFFSGSSFINRYEEVARWAETLGDPDFFYNLDHNHYQTRYSWNAVRDPYYLDTDTTYHFNVPLHPKPMVENITVSGSTIAITGNEHVLGIQWIADGEVVHRTAGRESTIDLAALLDDIGAHVRAELFGLGGVLYTQPFLLRYEGMPAPTLTPDDFIDWGRGLAFGRFVLFYPIGRLTDLLWRAIYGWMGWLY